MQHKTSLNDTLAGMMLVIYFAELVFPMVTTLLPSAVVCIVCFGMWLLLVTTVNPKFLLWRTNFFLLMAYLYMAVYPIIFGNSTIANRYLSLSLVLSGYIIFRYYYSFNKLYILKKILVITIVLSFITMLITFSQLLINPYISRSIKSSGEYSASLAKQGIGGYTFVYYITALCVPALYYSMKAKNRWKRILAVAWYVFSVIFIVKSNYMTALLAVVVSSAMLIMLSTMKNKKWGAVGSLFLAALLIFLVCNLDKIIILVADFLPRRIADVLVSGGGESVVESIMKEFVLDRWPVMVSSFEGFFSHPFLGLVGSEVIRIEGGYLTGFGQHSFILDTFALYGVIGGIVGVLLATYPLKKNSVWKKHSALRIAMLSCAVILYLFNNATNSIALVVSIIAPFCACITSCDESAEEVK